MSSLTPSEADVKTIIARLTPTRLSSYTATAADPAAALRLYDWNVAASGALYEDLGRVEVVVRNAFDAALVEYGHRVNWSLTWYDRASLFPGRHGQRAMADIAEAKRRAARATGSVVHGSVIAELSFGFWRFLCTPPYLTSLWVPVLGAVFPHHPAAGSPRQVRADVEDRLQRCHFLRNRVAHHEPVHHRDLARDHRSMTEILGWIRPVTSGWFTAESRSAAVLAERPRP